MVFSSAEKSRQGSFPHHFLLLVGIRIQPAVFLTLRLLVLPLKFLIQLFKCLTWGSAFSSKILAHTDAAGQGPYFENHCTTMTREVVSGFIATESFKKKKKTKHLKSLSFYKRMIRCRDWNGSGCYCVHVHSHVWLCIIHFSSVAQSCLTLCNPMNRSTPGLPVHHQLPEFTQTHAYWVGDVIQPSHPLMSPSPALNPSQHQSLFQWVNSSHEVAKVLKFQL